MNNIDRKWTTRGTAYCSALNCFNARGKRLGLVFHSFPKDAERAKIWIQNSGRKDLLNKDIMQLNKHHSLCSIHFEDNQFMCKRNKSRLIWNAIPTLFHFLKETINPLLPITTTRPDLKDISVELEVFDIKRAKIGGKTSQPVIVQNITNNDVAHHTAVSIKTENEADNMQDEYVNAEDNLMMKINRIGKRRRKRCCSAINCSSKKEENLELVFFSFPRDVERSKIWAQNCGREDLIEMDASVLSKNHLLCSKHFEANQFVGGCKKKLVSNAVPTLFYFLQPTQYHLFLINEIVPDKSENSGVDKESEQIECPEMIQDGSNGKDPLPGSNKEVAKYTVTSVSTNMPSSSFSTASVTSTSGQSTSNLSSSDDDTPMTLKMNQTVILKKKKSRLGKIDCKVDKINCILNITKNVLSEEQQQFLENELKYSQKKCLCQEADQL